MFMAALIWRNADGSEKMLLLFVEVSKLPNTTVAEFNQRQSGGFLLSWRHRSWTSFFQGQAMSHTVTSQHSSAKVEGLRAATPYVVQVRARTVAGYGRYSNPMDFSTSLHSMHHFLFAFAWCPGQCADSFLNGSSGSMAFMNPLTVGHYTSAGL